MAAFEEIAFALVDAGYLSEADVDAAISVLKDALIVDVAEEAEDEAAADYAAQEDLVAEAEVWEAEDAAVGDEYEAEVDAEIIADAIDRQAADMETMAAAEAVIDAACSDAAAALLAAALIDEANMKAVSVVIHQYRCG